MGKAKQGKARNPVPRPPAGTRVFVFMFNIMYFSLSYICNYISVHQAFIWALKHCFFPQLLQRLHIHHSFIPWCSSFWHFHHKLFNNIGFQSNALTLKLKSCWCHLPDVHVYWIKILFVCFISNYKNTWGILDVIPHAIQRPMCILSEIKQNFSSWSSSRDIKKLET